LDAGAEKEVKDVDGDTAQSFAEQKNHPECVEILKNE
jgi:ankyrin repeat protein